MKPFKKGFTYQAFQFFLGDQRKQYRHNGSTGQNIMTGYLDYFSPASLHSYCKALLVVNSSFVCTLFCLETDIDTWPFLQPKEPVVLRSVF